jgi:hypothetical protein
LPLLIALLIAVIVDLIIMLLPKGGASRSFGYRHQAVQTPHLWRFDIVDRSLTNLLAPPFRQSLTLLPAM